MDIFFKIKRKKIRFISSFFSALTYLLGYSIIMESGNFSVYFISNIHYSQKWVNMQYGNLMRPFVLLFLSIFAPLSGVMETLLGSRLAILTSFSVIEVALIFLYFQKNVFIFYTLSLFLGIGCGLAANIAVKNACLYYPKKKGLISALVMSLGAMIGSSYTYLGEKIINPKREKVIDKEKEPYYKKEIAERSKYFFLLGMVVIPTSLALSLFLFYKYDPSCEIEQDGNEKIENKVDEIKGPLLDKNEEAIENNNNENQNKEENKEINNEEKENQENTENKDSNLNVNENEKKDEDNNNKEGNNKEEKKVEKINVSNSYLKPSPKKNIKKALKKWRFWRNILISGVMPFGLFFIFTTYRAYASLLGVDGKIVGTLASAINIVGSTFNPVWAFLTDKYGFQPIIRIIAICVVGVNIYFFIFMNNKTFYVIGLYMSCIFRGGVLACITPHIMHIYGLRYYLTLGGFGRLFNQVFSFIIAWISIIFSIFFDTAKELLWPYRIMCVVGVGFAVMGLVLIFFETDEKFNFDDDEEKIEETENIEEKKESEEKKETEQNKEKEDNKESNEEIIKKEEGEKKDKEINEEKDNIKENQEEKKEENEDKEKEGNNEEGKEDKNEELKGDNNKNEKDNNKEVPNEEQNNANEEKNENIDKDEVK